MRCGPVHYWCIAKAYAKAAAPLRSKCLVWSQWWSICLVIHRMHQPVRSTPAKTGPNTQLHTLAVNGSALNNSNDQLHFNHCTNRFTLTVPPAASWYLFLALFQTHWMDYVLWPFGHADRDRTEIIWSGQLRLRRSSRSVVWFPPPAVNRLKHPCINMLLHCECSCEWSLLSTPCMVACVNAWMLACVVRHAKRSVERHVIGAAHSPVSRRAMRHTWVSTLV